MTPAAPVDFLRKLFECAVASAHPDACLPAYLLPLSSGRVIVIGAGKAAASMAAVVERHYTGAHLDGVVIVPDGYGVPCARIEVIEASHPVPDARGMAAAARILDLARGAGPGDTVLALISGGASALMALPALGVTLDDKRRITTALLRSGADIAAINCVRKHLSAIKGGRLAAAAAPAVVHSLIISDVVGDDPAVIASGPTVPDPTRCADALMILEKYAIEIEGDLKARLRAGELETPKVSAGAVTTQIVATPAEALRAAAAMAEGAGLAVMNLGDRCDGEARAGAAAQAGLVREIRAGRGPVKAPCVILSGGEYVVTIGPSGRSAGRSAGRGGPNTEFALALALELGGEPGVWALAADTDGRDGNAGAAGAVISPDTLGRARAAGLDLGAALARNDSAGIFAALGGLVTPGPTYTNINDFRAILVAAT
jgi:glycerate 2-kinase